MFEMSYREKRIKYFHVNATDAVKKRITASGKPRVSITE